MKHDYFSLNYNLQRIKALGIREEEVIWLTEHLNTPYHQDALHIGKYFFKNKDKAEIQQIKYSVDLFYLYRHLIEPQFRDIKNLKNYDDLRCIENNNWSLISSNIKVLHKTLTPLLVNFNKKYTIFKVKTFEEAVALTHGHPCFDGNHYKFCHGVIKTYYQDSVSLTKKSKYFKYFNKEILNCNTFYHIRDHTRSTKYLGKIPNCLYEDVKHAIVILLGLKVGISYADNKTTYYNNIQELFKINPEYECFCQVLTGAPGWI